MGGINVQGKWWVVLYFPLTKMAVEYILNFGLGEQASWENKLYEQRRRYFKVWKWEEN